MAVVALVRVDHRQVLPELLAAERLHDLRLELASVRRHAALHPASRGRKSPYREVDREAATHKTTILLTPRLYRRLAQLARGRGTSMGQLIRSAVEAQYGLVDPDERSAAVAALGALALPVDTPQVMKAESDPFGREPMP